MSVEFSNSTGNIREFEPSSSNLEGPISINTDGTFFSDSLQLKFNKHELEKILPIQQQLMVLSITKMQQE